MPKPRAGESEKEYLGRAIAYMIHREGASPGQAWHKAKALYRKWKSGKWGKA